MTSYRVYYRRDPEFLTPKSPVSLADYEEVVTTSGSNPDDVFCAMNAVEGDELCCRLRVRSMSVGDLLLDESTGELLACSPCGWETVKAA